MLRDSSGKAPILLWYAHNPSSPAVLYLADATMRLCAEFLNWGIASASSQCEGS
jgi:hypothetical protein